MGGEGDDFSFLDVYEGAMGEYIFKDWSQGVNQVEQEYLRANGTKSHFFVLDVPEPMWGEKSKLLEYGKRQAERYKGVKSFFEKTFTDAEKLMPTLQEDFFRNPTSSLVTVKCFPWIRGDKFALIGDAAHAIVPFFGQGMNFQQKSSTNLFCFTFLNKTNEFYSVPSLI